MALLVEAVWINCSVLYNNCLLHVKMMLVSGPFRPSEMGEWFNAGYFSQNLNVKLGCDIGFIQLGQIAFCLH